MPKNRSNDSKDSATKNTLNPIGSEAGMPAGPDQPSAPGQPGGKVPSGAPPVDHPSGLTNERDPDDKIGQFTGRGSPGLQKR